MIFAANIWPVVNHQQQRQYIIDEIKNHGQYIRTIETSLTKLGLRNYLVEIYGHQQWSGNLRNRFRQINSCVNRRYKPDTTMLTCVFQEESLENVLKIKDDIRKYCGLGKDSIHISDSESEAKYMIDLLEKENNLALLNNYQPDKFRCFTKNLDKIKKQGRYCGMEPKDFLIVSKAVYALYNIKKIKEISWISTGKEDVELRRLNGHEYNQIFNQFQEQWVKKENQVWFYGFRFVNIELIKEMDKMTD